MRFAAQKPVWASCGRRPAHAGFTRIIALDTNTIQQLIEQGLPGARVAVRGDDGVHFEALVVSDAFQGKLPLARHRLVYARSEEHTSELQSLMRISYAVFCLKKTTRIPTHTYNSQTRTLP